MKLARLPALLAVLAIGFSSLLAGCSCNTAKPTGAEGELKVAGVLPGSITDKSFNQSGYEGLKLIESQLGIPVAYVEKVAKADQVENLQSFARQGHRIVIGHGGEFQPAVEQAAAKYPNTLFLVNNGTKAGGNVGVITFEYGQIGYLMGYIAAKSSKSGTVGFIGAEKIKTFLELAEGFEKGAKAGNAKKVLTAWTGDWDDVSKGKSAASAQIAEGADVLFPTMDNATIGSLTAAREKNIKAIGIYFDAVKDPQWAETVVQSAIIDIKAAMLETVKSMKTENKFEGKLYKYGVGRPEILGLGTYHASVPEAARKEVEGLIADFKSGKLQP